MSGLSGTGLVLRNIADAEILSISADGAFQFPTSFDSGTQYTVEIETQPRNPTQVCSIANGSGTIADHDVASVSITCTTSRFTVGGSVSGLQGSGLVVTTATGDSMTISANGSFVFPTTVASGSPYDVSVTQQPSGWVYCRISKSSGIGTVGNSNVTSVAVECGEKRPPPFSRFCAGTACSEAQPVRVRVCPSAQPNCLPSRSTRVYLRIDGVPVSGGFVGINGLQDEVVTMDAGAGDVIFRVLRIHDAPYAEILSDTNVSFTHYNVAPVWGGTTNVEFVSSLLSNSTMDSTFYRHVSYDTGTAITDVMAQASAAVATEREIVDLTSEKIDAYFLPTELTSLGEGNWSFGNGQISVNYGNPDYIAALGGILNTAIPRFAHENSHELFNEIQPDSFIYSTCLNEGVADALAYTAGFLPEAEFGPVGLRGLDFELDGCLAVSEVHDVGNCPLWHIKRAGLLTSSFLRGIFHPQHALNFDSCSLSHQQTGNALLVLFTEAADGKDVRPALDAAGIPHARTYAEALIELGL